MNVLRSALLAGSQNPWLRRQATGHPFVRRAVSRFMPGETLDEALRAASALQARGLGTILTHLGENVTDRAEAEAVTAHYLDAVDRVHGAALDGEISVKLTQLGLDLDDAMAFEHLTRIATRARAHSLRIWIDMEQSEYVGRTLDVFRRARLAGHDVGVCLQAYLKRTPQDLDGLLPLGPAIRLVKGAYDEPATIAFARKRDVDESFFAIAERLLEHRGNGTGAQLVAATHDTRLIRRIQELARARGLERRSFEFAMLYGIQRDEQTRLAREGYRVRVLISYGAYWFPWYMRRLAERPANLMFVLRSMLGS